MSCEQLLTGLKTRKEDMDLTLERVKVGHFIQRLLISCPNGGSRKTHTSRILYPEEAAAVAELDRIWEEVKPEAEEYLRNLEPNA